MCVCVISITGRWYYVLKMNFSVEVNMYREKVTSYWYFFNWSQRAREARYETRGCSLAALA